MLRRDSTMFSHDPTNSSVPSEEVDYLSNRAAELERQADEQLLLLGITANGYMKRLHRELAESLRLEAAILRRQRETMADAGNVVPRWAIPPEHEGD